MIVLDASIFLRMLATPGTPQDAGRAAAARVLFQSSEERAVEATTNDVVLAEVAFVLTSPRHDALPRPRAAVILGQLHSPAEPRRTGEVLVPFLPAHMDRTSDARLPRCARHRAHPPTFDGDVRRFAGEPLREADGPDR